MFSFFFHIFPVDKIYDVKRCQMKNIYVQKNILGYEAFVSFYKSMIINFLYFCFAF